MVKLLAENDHNVWARERIAQGWTYGTQQVYVLAHMNFFSCVQIVFYQRVHCYKCALLLYGFNIKSVLLGCKSKAEPVPRPLQLS